MMDEEFKKTLSNEHDAFINIAEAIGRIGELENFTNDENFDAKQFIKITHRRSHAATYLRDLAELMLKCEEAESFKVVDGLACAIAVFEFYDTDNKDVNDVADKLFEGAYNTGIFPWPPTSDEDEENEEEE